MVRRGLAGVLAVLLSTMAAVTALGSTEVPPELSAVLLLKVLNYDRSVALRSPAVVTLGVLKSPADTDAYCTRMLAALQDSARKVTVAGKSVRVVSLVFASLGDLDAQLAREQVVGLYVCSQLDNQVSVLSSITRRRRILSIGGSDAAVRNGLGVAIVSRDQKPAIVVNLAAARAEGADLDAALLRVSEVLK